MANHNDFGKWGEDVSVSYLTENGYEILARNWRHAHQEIDIIAQRDGTLYFVEVKTRRNTIFGEPEDAIDWHKRQSLQQAINHYVKFKHLRQEIRFDIISIVGTPETGADIRHVIDVALL
jgi:putative endonuclease